MEKSVSCPKCKNESGDAWGQCGKACPMPFSPHFQASTRDRYVSKDKTFARFISKLARHTTLKR